MSSLLSHRYQILQTLGSGGFGETYLVEDTHMPSKRRCVLKRLKPVTHNPQVYQIVQERFQKEAAILEDVGNAHDQIPDLYAYFDEAGELYLVQEWVAGQTLTKLVETEGPLPEAKVLAILLSILPVISFVHAKGIIHRDIKPDNILLRDRDQQAILIDFGAVKETLGLELNSQGATTSSIVIGTPGYMPSEQAAGRPLFTSDLFSLGLTAIFLLTGRHPQSLLMDPHTGEFTWQQFAPQISPGLAAVLDRAIQGHPRDRFATAQEMLTALQPLVQSVPQTLPYTPSGHSDAPPVSSTLPPTTLQSGNAAVPGTVPSPPPLVSGSSGGVPPTELLGASVGGPVATGTTPATTVPPEILGWNWGAFLLPGCWCFSNCVWVGLTAWPGLLLCGLGWLGMGGLLGAKGNEWAWKSRSWQSVAAFKAHQRGWAIGGVITWGLLIGLVILTPTPEEETADTPEATVSPPTATFSPETEPSLPAATLSPDEVTSETSPNDATGGSPLDGQWQLRFSNGTILHESVLTMTGGTGSMTTQYFDIDLNRQVEVQQSMTLQGSPQGMMVVGSNPVDAATGQPIASYRPDNLVFRLQPDGTYQVQNCEPTTGSCVDVEAALLP